MNRNNSLLLFIIFFYACSAQKQLRTIDYSHSYGNLIGNPQFKVYHTGTDSSLFYYYFTNNDLLFKKNDAGFFEANIALEYSLYSSYYKSDILDSASSLEKIIYDSTGTGYTGSVRFRALFGNDYILKIRFRDLNKKSDAIYVLNVKKTERQSAQFFDMRYLDDLPVMNPEIPKKMKVKIIPPSLTGDSLIVHCYFRRFPLASPPFSENATSVFEYSADSIYYLKTSSLESVMFMKAGFYHLQIDTFSRQGFTVFLFDDDFPSFTRPEQLIESLRYLCTRAEYNDLLGKPDKKKAIDDYWLDKAGNNERGRKLIKVYYNRSFTANKLFTSYLEGWKTDRGMIYLVFGPPRSVYRDKKQEIWRYPVAEGIPDIQFIFTKINNPFSDNDYELERNKNYQNIWYQAVENWRSGRIVGVY